MIPDAIVVIQPARGFPGRHARPMLGVVIRGRAYFAYHALAGGGNDARRALRNVQYWLNMIDGLNVTHAIIGGDFNRTPGDLLEHQGGTPMPDNAVIIATGQPTHRTGTVIDAELDYMVALTRWDQNPLPAGNAEVDYDTGLRSDHYPVIVTAPDRPEPIIYPDFAPFAEPGLGALPTAVLQTGQFGYYSN